MGEFSLKTIVINFDDFKKEGLYLFPPDSSHLKIIREDIDRIADEFWNDPNKLSPEIKEAMEFQPCDHCSQHGNVIYALSPIQLFSNKTIRKRICLEQFSSLL